MKQNDISELPSLESDKYENIFNVYQTDDKFYYYNLLRKISFPTNLPNSLFESYTTKYGDTWPFISYKLYNSPNLWWVILYANSIQNPTQKILPGTTLKIPTIEVVREILDAVKK
jgi:hypothetical protein